MKSFFAPVTCILLASSLAAQSGITSPKGFELVEGNATFFHWGANRRFQQIDNTHKGTPAVVMSLAWRRDGAGGGANVPARTFDMEILMGHVNMAQLSRVFDRNWNLAAPTRVYGKKQTNFPNWTGNMGSPAPFDFKVVLDRPFVYNGADALCFDFTVENPTSTLGGTMDRQYVAANTGNGNSLGGSGCIATGRTAAFAQIMRLENNGATCPNYGMRIRVNATNAPADAGVFLMVSNRDAALTVPGLCHTVHAVPIFFLLAGLATTAGVLPETSFSFGHDSSLEGAPFVTQLFALDLGQAGVPAVLSNGTHGTMPVGPAITSHEALYTWSTLPTVEGILLWGGCAVAFLANQ
jgi:hypothetical protein